MSCIEFPSLEQERRYDIYIKLRDILTSRSRCIIGSFMTNRIGAFFPLSKDDGEADEEETQRELMQNLFSLLSTGITAKIRIGVSQPAFHVSHGICAVLLLKHDIKPIVKFF